jgi:hypothetical protein
VTDQTEAVSVEVVAKIVHENGPVVVDFYGPDLAWRPLGDGMWTAIPTPPKAPLPEGSETKREHVMPGDPLDIQQIALQWYLSFDFGYPHSVRESNIAVEGFKDGYRAALSVIPAPPPGEYEGLVERLKASANEHQRYGEEATSTDELIDEAATAITTLTQAPGSLLNECVTELGDAEPFVVQREADGWAVRTMSGWRALAR